MSWHSLLHALFFLVPFLLARTAGAVSLPFTGVLEIDLVGVVTSFTGGGSAIVNGSGAGVHVSSLNLPAGAIATTGLVIGVTDPSASPIKGVQVTAANGPGAFAETAMGTLRGTMPIAGAAKVCLFGSCNASPVANLTVPLSVVGVGGRAVASAAINLTIEGAAWTTGTAVNTFPFTPFTTTRMGHAYGPLGQASSTGQASGSIQFVTPYTVWTNIGADQPSVFGFVTMTLHFVPEPATLALLMGGCIALGLQAHRRSF